MHRPARLRHSHRRRPAHVKPAARGERGRVRERRAARDGIEEREVNKIIARGNRRVLRGLVHDQQRQRRRERERVGVQAQIHFAARRAGEQARLIGSCAEVRGVREQQRRGKNGRRGRRQRAVQRVAHDRIGDAGRELQRERFREISTRLGKNHLRREALSAAGIGPARRGSREKTARRRLAPHAAVGDIGGLFCGREFGDDSFVGIDERKIAARRIEPEIRVQLRENLGAILARREHEQVFVRQQNHAGEFPLHQIRARVGEEPAREIHRRLAAVVQLDPARVVAVIIEQAALIDREKFRQINPVEPLGTGRVEAEGEREEHDQDGQKGAR